MNKLHDLNEDFQTKLCNWAMQHDIPMCQSDNVKHQLTDIATKLNHKLIQITKPKTKLFCDNIPHHPSTTFASALPTDTDTPNDIHKLRHQLGIVAKRDGTISSQNDVNESGILLAELEECFTKRQLLREQKDKTIAYKNMISNIMVTSQVYHFSQFAQLLRLDPKLMEHIDQNIVHTTALIDNLSSHIDSLLPRLPEKYAQALSEKHRPTKIIKNIKSV